MNKKNKKNIFFRKSKAGMDASEIFIYILALIVASVIFLYGYDAVTKMQKQTNTVALLQFKSDLTNTIDTLSYDYDSVIMKKLTLPTGFTQICFVDPKGDPNSVNNIVTESSKELVKDQMNQQNVGPDFVVMLIGDKSIETFKVKPLQLYSDKDQNPPTIDALCITSQSSIVNLKLKANGNAIGVSQQTG